MKSLRVVVSFSTASLFVVAPHAFGQQGPPVRQLATATAVSSDTLASVTAAVSVGGGRVFVNDIVGRRLLLLDSALANATVVADSDGTVGESYGNRPGTLLPFRGDSALFIAPASLSMLVLTPQGRVARVMAMPPSGGGVAALLGSIFGTPGFDARGRLVFFSPSRMIFNQRGGPGAPGADGPIRLEPPDSALIVRFDFATRTMDTVGSIKIPRTRSSMTRDDQGRMRLTMTAIPPAVVDDWAVTADGRIAIVRGRDYHVEWLDAAGAWSSTPRMPYAWEPLNDSQKVALIDSVAAFLQAQMDSMPMRMQQSGNAVRGDRGAPGGGGQTMTIVMGGPGGEAPRGGGPGGPGGGGGGGGPTSISMTVPTVTRAAPADVPDYRPAFTQAAVRADLDGNLWIRTTRFVDGRPIYDIVNGRGELIDRVQLPPFRTIAGFGRNVVYVGVRDASGVMHLESLRIR